MLQDVPLGQTYSQLRHYGRGVPPYFLIGSAQISRVSPEDSGGGGVQIARGLATGYANARCASEGYNEVSSSWQQLKQQMHRVVPMFKQSLMLILISVCISMQLPL